MPEKNKKYSYLEQLKFDPRLGKKFIAGYFSRVRVIVLVIITIILFGIFNYFVLPRTLNPEIKIPIVFVSTVLPGASPEDVESLVTIPLEEKLRGVKGLKQINSTSVESFSQTALEFYGDVDGEKARSDVQALVDEVTNLPEDAQDPKVQLIDFEDQALWQFAITTDLDAGSLHRFAQVLKERLSELPEIDRVVLSGMAERQIQIVIRPEELLDYHLDPLAVIGAIKAALPAYPAGNVQTEEASFIMALDSAIVDLADLREQIIKVEGQNITLGQIAEISEEEKPGAVKSYYIDQESERQLAVTFGIYRNTNFNVEDVVARAEEEVEKALAEYDQGFQLRTIYNMGTVIEDQFSGLFRNFGATIALVFLVIFLFIGIRQAAIASLAIPLAVLTSVIVISTGGLTLNFITIFSLLLSLGLLVDNAIVITTAMTDYYRTKKFAPLECGLLVFRDFRIPILTTSLTTIWAFIPLILSTGIIRDWLTPITLVVSSTLAASATIALFITIPLMVALFKPHLPKRYRVFFLLLVLLGIIGALISFLPKDIFLVFLVGVILVIAAVLVRIWQNVCGSARRCIEKHPFLKKSVLSFIHLVDKGLVDMRRISGIYQRGIEKIIEKKERRRKIFLMVILFSLFSYALLPLGYVVSEFFPKEEADQFFVAIELPTGTNVHAADQKAKALLAEFAKQPGVDFVIGEVGRGISMGFSEATSGSVNNMLFSIIMPPEKEREISSVEIAQNIRNQYQDYAQGKLSVVEISGGPPVGSDLQITFLGDQYQDLNKFADQTIAFLEEQPGIINVEKSIKPAPSKIVFTPDQGKLAQLGLNQDSLAFWLRLFASGMTIDELDLQEDSFDLVLRLNQDIPHPEMISALNLPTPQGDLPLASLGDLRLAPNTAQITREDGKRTLSVSASVLEDFSIAQKNQELEDFADTLDLPGGYQWQTGGLNEENQESVNSILRGMVIAVLLILITMVVQFNSFRQAVIVLLTIPLAISGVFLVFALTGTTLSFPALIGVLALFGIVVNNAIILVDKINANRKQGINLKESISDAAASRLEPIFFSSLTTIIGLIPITLSEPLWRGLGGAVISGLIFSGTITLFFIPTMYYYWFHREDERKQRVASLN